LKESIELRPSIVGWLYTTCPAYGCLLRLRSNLDRRASTSPDDSQQVRKPTRSQTLPAQTNEHANDYNLDLTSLEPDDTGRYKGSYPIGWRRSPAVTASDGTMVPSIYVNEKTGKSTYIDPRHNRAIILLGRLPAGWIVSFNENVPQSNRETEPASQYQNLDKSEAKWKRPGESGLVARTFARLFSIVIAGFEWCGHFLSDLVASWRADQVGLGN
jgi:hypothetical protein